MNEITLLNGDCLEMLETLPDDSFDLVLTDPPYGDGIGYGRMDKKIENNEDESINYKVLPILYRKLKNNTACYVFSNWKFAPKIIDFVENKTDFTVRMQLVIVKNNIGMGYGFRNQYELCLVLEKGKVKYNGNDVSNVLKMEHIHHDKDTHPHQKGIELLARLIKHSTEEGAKVLDPFLGSGSTAVACKLTNRQCVGIELSKEYFDVAQGRVDNVGTTLF